MKSAKNKPEPDYQSLKDELDQVLEALQREDCDVDEALKGYERGLELVGQLEAYLQSAENHIKQIQTDQE